MVLSGWHRKWEKEVEALHRHIVSVLKIVGFVVLLLLVLFGTSMYYMTRGLNETLNLEIGEINLAEVDDGVYTGEYLGYRWSNQVDVTVIGHQIIEILPKKSQAFHMDEPINSLIESILTQQDLAVDITSGATASSKAFLKAVENALVQ